jgi:hypothetical protein
VASAGGSRQEFFELGALLRQESRWLVIDTISQRGQLTCQRGERVIGRVGTHRTI